MRLPAPTAMHDDHNRAPMAVTPASSLTRQARLDLLDVAVGLRPAARIFVREGAETHEGLMIIERFGLDACAGRGLVRIPVGEAFADGFAARAEARCERMAALYVARNHHGAERARTLDEAADDGGLGTALGYPACCVGSVIARGGVPSLSESVWSYSDGSGFDPLLWPAAALADGALLPHFPCGPSCTASRSMALARWRAVQSTMPELATPIVQAARARYWVDAAGRAQTDARGAVPGEDQVVVTARGELRWEA